MKLTKKKLMENAGLLHERSLSTVAQMVGSWAANYVGFEVTISGGRLVDGGSVTGDYLVVGYGRMVADITNEFTANTKPSYEVLLIQKVGASSPGSQTMAMYCTAGELDKKIQVK